MILLQNAKIFDGEKIINQNSILIKNNKFKNIGVNLKSSKDTNKIIGKIAKKDIKPDAILKKSLFKK